MLEIIIIQYYDNKKAEVKRREREIKIETEVKERERDKNMSRDNWERLVSAVVRRQQIWELCHDHSRTPSISTIPSDDDDDHFDEQFLDITNNRWTEALSVSPPAPLLNNPPSVYQVGNKYGGAITRNLFRANWYRGKKTKQEYRIDIPGVATFPLRELKIATDNFADRNVLYNNGFAKLYKGRLANGILVAVKRYKQKDISTARRHLQTEVDTMSVADVHPNLLRLVGVCVTQKENLLVYPYMTNGSVAQCLRERPESQPPLDWPVRKRIAVGAARGLAYLHDDCYKKIIYRDVKAANIFLNNKFEATIGNFEFAILMYHGVTHVEDTVRGTIGHIAPEYLSKGICSEKTDVFVYGIFLLELITGQRAFDLARLANDEDVMLLDWVKTNLEEKKWERILDRDCRGDYIEEGVGQLTQIALLCAQNTPEKRPKMSEIVRMILQLGDGDNLLAQKWEVFDNEAHQELMKRSDGIL